jgi:hypothetical protein
VYRFRNIDVPDVRPFDSGQSICFSDDFTLVENGGERTIIKKLYQEYLKELCLDVDQTGNFAGDREKIIATKHAK